MYIRVARVPPIPHQIIVVSAVRSLCSKCTSHSSSPFPPTSFPPHSAQRAIGLHVWKSIARPPAPTPSLIKDNVSAPPVSGRPPRTTLRHALWKRVPPSWIQAPNRTSCRVVAVSSLIVIMLIERRLGCCLTGRRQRSGRVCLPTSAPQYSYRVCYFAAFHARSKYCDRDVVRG